MRFWDTSAVVPLLVDERTTSAADAESRRDPTLVVWWATEVECASAIARLEREGGISAAGAASAADGLAALAAGWQVVQPSDRLRQTARRLLRTHPLRAADAFQLAAAIVASDGDPGTLPFVSLDDRLAEAAAREGFPVVRLA